jgi:hypothetical protein
MHRFNDIREKFNAMKKESQKSRGLGDSIEKFTAATGIKAVWLWSEKRRTKQSVPI